MKPFLEIFAIFLSSVNLLMTRFVLFGLRQPTSVPAWMAKVFTSAVSPLLLLLGLLFATLGLILNSILLIVTGSCAALLYLLHIIKITRPGDPSTGLERAFGVHWKSNISPEKTVFFLPGRYVLRLPNPPKPIFDRNIIFYTIPDADRHLFCDVWQPPKKVKHSGLAFIYLHGSAWTALDKDFGTRTFFRHLAAQGHVIMDVAYRLFPETNFMGMVHDAKHAIAWMKANATTYGIDPRRIVIGGGSAGAHIALLAAYTQKNSPFTPKDLEQDDLSVRAVVSAYGQTDLVATYYHTCQHLVTHSSLGQKGLSGMPSWIRKSIGKDFHRLGFDKDVEPGMLSPILGGTPDERPDAYSLFSPITHVHNGCPPTLLIHGKQDILAPVNAICEFYSRLTDAGVPAEMHLLPQTDHAFDLILTRISPSAHNALYDTERFIARLI